MRYEESNIVVISPGTYPGLSDAIAAAGHYLENRDGLWYADDAVAVQAIINTFQPVDPLVAAKAEKSAAVSARAKDLRDKVVASISKGEMASWSIKKAQAVQFKTDGTLPANSLLAMEATARGIPLATLVDKVFNNATRFESAEAAIGGADGLHRDAIASLTTVESVVDYNFDSHWPEI